MAMRSGILYARRLLEEYRYTVARLSHDGLVGGGDVVREALCCSLGVTRGSTGLSSTCRKGPQFCGNPSCCRGRPWG